MFQPRKNLRNRAFLLRATALARPAMKRPLWNKVPDHGTALHPAWLHWVTAQPPQMVKRRLQSEDRIDRQQQQNAAARYGNKI
jgi:hypothetical protein